MSADTPPPRPAAASLHATYRADGIVRLELIEDWYTTLEDVSCPASDTAQIRELLTGWALQPTRSRSARYAGRRTGDSYGLEATVLGTASRGVCRWSNCPEQFARLFGTTPSAPSEELETFTRSLARDIGTHLTTMRRRAAERLAGGAYLPVLEAHLQQCRAFGDDPHAYRRVERTLVPIVEGEQYLRIAEDERARRLFRELEDEIWRLYGQCMSFER